MATLSPDAACLRSHTPAATADSAGGAGACLALTLLLAGCAAVGQSSGHSGGGFAAPAESVNPVPDYLDNCAPVGIDTSSPCLRITLDAIDKARAHEGLPPHVAARPTSVA